MYPHIPSTFVVVLQTLNTSNILVRTARTEASMFKNFIACIPLLLQGVTDKRMKMLSFSGVHGTTSEKTQDTPSSIFSINVPRVKSNC